MTKEMAKSKQKTYHAIAIYPSPFPEIALENHAWNTWNVLTPRVAKALMDSPNGCTTSFTPMIMIEKGRLPVERKDIVPIWNRAWLPVDRTSHAKTVFIGKTCQEAKQLIEKEGWNCHLVYKENKAIAPAGGMATQAAGMTTPKGSSSHREKVCDLLKAKNYSWVDYEVEEKKIIKPSPDEKSEGSRLNPLHP